MYTKYISVIIISLFLSGGLFGQSNGLKRKGALGIAFQAVDDSTAKANYLKETIGVYVLRVLPDATMDKMGVKSGDIITKIDEYEVNSVRGVLDAIANLRADDDIEIEYYREGKLKTKKGNAEARPMEVSQYGEVLYEEVSYKGNRLRSILHLPHGIEKPPVVFYIQGYTCQSVEYPTDPNHSIRRIIDDWVKDGFAVYRIEKPNIGDSDCDKGCFELDFNEELEAFRQGYMNLKADARIDSSNIFLFGHSIGGIIAPVLGADFQPKGIITYGTVLNSWFEYMQELTRVQGEMFNTPYAEIERDIRNATPFWYAMFIEKKTPEEILKNPSIAAMLKEEGTLESFKNGQFIYRHYTYWSAIQDIELTNEWLKVKSHVLALYGEFDIQALNANHVYKIAEIVNSHAPGKAQAQVIKEADHGFVRFSSMEENINSLNSNNYGRDLREKYHEGVAKATISWMQKLVNE